MYLYEESERLEHADCATRLPQLIAYDQKIEELDTRYWENQRLTWKLEGNLPLGFMTKAFKQCRANMDWYLCSWMRQDCAGRGGCCGRGCGCCAKIAKHCGRRRGHCTSSCQCCAQAQGRLTGKHGKLSDMDDFPFDVVKNDSPYSERIFRAYIWGLSFLTEMGF